MGSRGTNNSLQTALLFLTASSGEEAPLQNAISLAGENVLPPTLRQASPASLQPAGPAIAGVSPELVALISQTVQAAVAAERASSSAAAIATSLSSSTAVNPSSDRPPRLVGIPDSLPSLAGSAASLLAAGTGFGVQSVQGRPSHSLVVPSFVSTFALLSMSSFASSASATNVCSSESGAIRDIAARSVGQPASLLDHPFVVGPGFSSMPVKIVAQIVAGKYVDLSELLSVNLLQKELEPQLLFDGLITRHKIEDIASWMEAFSIFALILVTHFPH